MEISTCQSAASFLLLLSLLITFEVSLRKNTIVLWVFKEIFRGHFSRIMLGALILCMNSVLLTLGQSKLS